MRRSISRISTLFLLVLIVVLFQVASSKATLLAHKPLKFTVTEILVTNDKDMLVAAFQIESRPGTVVRLKADKPFRGEISAGVNDNPTTAQKLPTTRFTLFADHVTWKDATDLLKVQYSLASGGKARASTTGPMPEGKSLSEVIKVTLKPGTYDEGVPVEAFQFNGDTFHLTIEPLPR